MSHDYFLNSETAAQYIELAQSVNSQVLIDILRGYLPENSKLLELGTGPGNDIAYLKQFYQITGSDYSEAFLTHLRQRFPHDTFLHLDALTLETTETFDGIYANKVFHLFSDAQIQTAIGRLRQVLAPNGIIALSFWQGEGEENYSGMHVYYRTAESLTALFGEVFEVLYLKPYQEFEPEDSLFLIARRRAECHQ